MKVKVAFLLDISNGWLGGVNYYRNLLTAVTNYGSGMVDFFVLVPDHVDMNLFKGYPEVIKFQRTSLFERWSLLGFCRRAVSKLFRKDYITALYLRLQGVQMISHLQNDLKYPFLKTAAWIPDFQHKHCPEFFTEEQLRGRDQAFLRQAQRNDIMILSSYDAKKDFERYYPDFAEEAEVLHFVPSLDLSLGENVGDVLKKYALPQKFFYVPNQYWIHKNHQVILQALKLLKGAGHDDIVVVSTGNTSDHRAPGYFEKITGYINEHQLRDNYKVLGLIPYDDVQALAALCHAYINPSFFEGWSTTVEEAKYRGKCILLSNLGVHKEQNPKYGIFFDPKNPTELAEKMLQVWNAPRVQENEVELVKLSQNMKREFAKRFEEIVLRTIMS